MTAEQPKVAIGAVSGGDAERAIQVILTHARSGERGEGVVAAHDEAATTA
jgi:hypothetical protein